MLHHNKPAVSLFYEINLTAKHCYLKEIVLKLY
jgi:hypothetical protein